ncbi:MAG: hypothetical protein DWQ01_13635 [Planctomycetota bacterium]|nr:MAG: hypothetical protein DWQ01_13635 [Planctomycetota bacterium]
MAKPIPTLEWLHICDYAFRDEHGKLCLIGLFDALHSVRLPGRLPMFSVAIGLTDGEGQYEAGLQILAPSGKTIHLKLPPFQLAERRAKARAVIRLASLPFEEFGRYTFRLVVDGQPVDYPVHLLDHLELKTPPGQAGPGGNPPTGGPGFEPGGSFPAPPGGEPGAN